MEAIGYKILYHPQPDHLFWGEFRCRTGLFFKHPVLKIFIYCFIEAGQRGVYTTDFPYQAYQGY